MGTIITRDDTRIFYKDWGTGQPIVFSHGWPLSADAWDGPMLYLLNNGYRVVAHDRRGHGRSAQTASNNTMDQYADDLSDLMEQLNLKDVVLVGHSTGGGEVTRYIGRYGTTRVSKLVLVSAVPPLMLKTEKNTDGLPQEVFDEIRSNVLNNRAQYYRDITLPFFGFNREGVEVQEGVRDSFWLQAMMGGIKAQYDSIKEFSESDFTNDLKKIDVPVLIIHGDDDQIVPIGASAMRSVKLIADVELKIYGQVGHGLVQTHFERFVGDLLGFVRAGRSGKETAA